jgi:hypothetical protein
MEQLVSRVKRNWPRCRIEKNPAYAIALRKPS